MNNNSYNQYFLNYKSFENYIRGIKKLSFSIIAINIRSISSIEKFNKFKTLISKLPWLPSIISVQETWFNKDLVQLYNIAGYNSIHCCRHDGYGGTSIWIRENLQYKVDVCESKDFFDSIVLTLNNSKLNGKSIKFISFYRSQKCVTENFLEYLESLLCSYGREPCIFAGDSNIDCLDRQSSAELLNLLANFNFMNCHTMITRPQSGTSIDHVYSNVQNSLFIESVECGLSDHNMISCRIEIQTPLQISNEDIRLICDYDRVRETITNNLPRLCQTGDPSIDTKDLISFVNDAVKDCTFEKRQTRIIANEITPWININLQKLIVYKQHLLRKRRKNRGNQEIEERLKRISNVIKKANKTSMNNFYKDKLYEVQNDPKKCWVFLNETLGRKHSKTINLINDSGEIVENDLQKAEIFNRYFLQSIKDLRLQIEQYPIDSCNSLRTLIQTLDRFNFSFTTYDEIHTIISNLTPSKSGGHDNILPKILLNNKNDLTPYLVNIFNNMIRRSIYPDILKIHKIVPIPKGKNACTTEMFRPIAVLSIIDNVFERILHNQISNYMKSNNLLNDFQFGFRKGCGTEEAVVNVVNFICKGLDEGNCGVAALFFDLTKAFDLVDHEILAQKLRYYGICGRELSLLKCYLTKRKQFVQINTQKSALGAVEYGVPQGSVLGPLLFSIYMNDLKNLEISGKLFIYADDICLLYPYKYEAVAKAYVERDAALISEFLRLNKLLLNANKTRLVRFKPYNNRNNNFSVFVDGKEILEENSINYLGLQLQSNLSWNQHIQCIKTKTAQAVGVLYKFKNKFDQHTKFLIYNALIQSHFNYLAILYGHKNSSELKSLQRMQNKALKVVSGVAITYPTASIYKDLFKTVLPIYGIYKMQLLVYVFKCLHNIGHHTIRFSQNQHSFNTRNRRNLTVARCRLETTKQRIEYMGSHEYNNLPQFLKNLSGISIFKSNLKKYLLQQIEELL